MAGNWEGLLTKTNRAVVNSDGRARRRVGLLGREDIVEEQERVHAVEGESFQRLQSVCFSNAVVLTKCLWELFGMLTTTIIRSIYIRLWQFTRTKKRRFRAISKFFVITIGCFSANFLFATSRENCVVSYCLSIILIG